MTSRSQPARHDPGGPFSRLGATTLLVAAIVALGLAPLAMPDSYSWVEYGTSESGAQGVDGAWAARSGFILFGLGVLAVVKLRARTWGLAATLLHGTFGVCLFAVAAFSAKPWEEGATYVESEDFLHSLFASIMGFGIVAGIATLIVLRRERSPRTAVPDWFALVVTTTIPLAMDSGIWGLLQRLMFVTAALWYSKEIWATSSASTPDQSLGRTDISFEDATRSR